WTSRPTRTPGARGRRRRSPRARLDRPVGPPAGLRRYIHRVPGGGTERLSDDDAQILRLESDAIKGHTAKLAIVEPGPAGPLGIEALRERVAAGIERIPRAGQRVVIEPAGEAAWQ